MDVYVKRERYWRECLYGKKAIVFDLDETLRKLDF